ncbi:hypothetical protein [Ruegeria arenilitoris]|uniref:hypothetical protein n=1 Tax=Ruegeria arenilitoris TaxID=1173585 RepID=UPI001479BB8A|nr:hypothetical protein [Ruegeria arenilitoris]
MLKQSLTVLLMLAVAFLSACEKDTNTYPITGEQCGPDDPVKTLDAEDCFIPPAGT